jgi:hypothetical protein
MGVRVINLPPSPGLISLFFCDFRVSRAFSHFLWSGPLVLMLLERVNIPISFNIWFFLIDPDGLWFGRPCFICIIFCSKPHYVWRLVCNFALIKHFFFLDIIYYCTVLINYNTIDYKNQISLRYLISTQRICRYVFNIIAF